MADILEEVGPNGNVLAVVSVVDDVCYFYLFGTKDTSFETKAVWIRNLGEAPESLEVERMRTGQPPKNPARYCRHQHALAAPKSEDLRVVWLPEGNGAALYERDEILAIIPPWSRTKDFDGYARDAVGTGPVAWELNSDNALYSRFRDAARYWKRCEDKNFWPTIQSELVTRIEAACGEHSNYYAIDGGNWPPKALLRIPRDKSVLFVTSGISIRPQPNVELNVEEPAPYRRIEFGVQLPASWSDQALSRFGSYLSAQSCLPWSQYTWLGPGHTLPCDSWKNAKYQFALLLYSFQDCKKLSLGTQFDDPVNVLWFIPITAEERQLAINKSSQWLASQLPANRMQDA